MELLDMPAELVAKLMETAVVVNGLDQAMMLRLVCKTFDTEILRAISTTKAIEETGIQPRYCGERLISGYLLARTLADTQRTYLSSKVIGETIDFIISKMPEVGGLKAHCTSSLCVAAARAFTGADAGRVYEFITPEYDPYSTIHERQARTVEENSLAAAVFLNIKPLVSSLIRAGVRDTETYFGQPMEIAARQCDIEIAISIIDIEIAAKPSALNTALWSAVRGGNIPLLDKLTGPAYNTEFSLVNAYGNTLWRWTYDWLLQIASCSGDLNVITYLNQQAACGEILATRTPLSFLALEHDKKPTSEYMQDLILWVAANQGHVDSVCHALSNGADPNVSRGGHWGMRRAASALTAATMGGHDAIVRLLFARGASISDIHLASPPLKEAVRNGWLNIARFLIDHGAIINEVPKYNRGEILVPELPFEFCKEVLPLFIAIDHGQIECVRLLLENKADVSPYPNAGKEALRYAKSKGYTSIVQLLVKYGVEDVPLLG